MREALLPAVTDLQRLFSERCIKTGKRWESTIIGWRWNMMLLKGCPRCRGDLRINRDMYGEYKQCVQCGFMEDMEPVTNHSSSADVVVSGKKAA